MDTSDLEARLSRLESRVNTNPSMGFGSAVEQSMNAFAEKRTTANARALLDEIDKAEPNLDEGVMSGPTVTVTVTVTITITIKAKDTDETVTDPEGDPE
jgi:hypothetical protein